MTLGTVAFAGDAAGTTESQAITGHVPTDPASPRHRDRTRESQRQARQLLMEWDPLGVADTPEVADEHFGLGRTRAATGSWQRDLHVGGPTARVATLLVDSCISAERQRRWRWVFRGAAE